MASTLGTGPKTPEPNSVVPKPAIIASSTTSIPASPETTLVPSLEEKRDVVSHVKSTEVQLPDQIGSELTRKLRHKYASTYRKIFAILFTLNAAVFITLMVTSNAMPLSRDAASAASANLMVCILFRQEEFVNLCYEIAVLAPHSWPLGIRKRLAKVFHYGGFHSGAGVAATVWYLTYTILATQEWIQNKSEPKLIEMATAWIVITMFLIILASAYPSVRRKFHDHFEAFHRFAGWVSLIFFWVHNIVSARAAAYDWNKSISYVLVRWPNFWFICVTTACTIASWSRLRRRTVYPEKLSDHATRLHFTYRGMKPFYGLKISEKPLTEWHAFATIPDIEPESGKVDGFSVVVSNAGDFTKKQIMDADKRKLWVRGAPLHGLLYTSKLFRQIVIVATGSGIGPCLSLMYANVTPRRVLWSTRNPEATYGPKVVSAVLEADPSAVIWNTSTKGYPDIVLETYKLVKESNAEAVYIISNPKVTEKVVFVNLPDSAHGEDTMSILEKKEVHTDKAPAPRPVYSQTVMLGNMVFLSGSVGIDPSTKHLVEGSVGDRTTQILKNIGHVLEAAGSHLDKIVKVNVYITNVDDLDTMNEAYGNVFSQGFKPGADDGKRGFESGSRVEKVSSLSIADGLRTPVGKVPWSIIYERKLVQGFFSVTETEIKSALRLVLERLKLVIEPSSAVPLAVALYNEDFRALVEQEAGDEGWDIGLVFGGGNLNLNILAELLGEWRR
ncbi:Adenylate-forming reductase [Paramyrothecium foliicola]|nr:Adenylate-forming reductase [Paramyrothecium foliicola]